MTDSGEELGKCKSRALQVTALFVHAFPRFRYLKVTVFRAAVLALKMCVFSGFVCMLSSVWIVCVCVCVRLSLSLSSSVACRVALFFLLLSFVGATKINAVSFTFIRETNRRRFFFRSYEYELVTSKSLFLCWRVWSSLAIFVFVCWFFVFVFICLFCLFVFVGRRRGGGCSFCFLSSSLVEKDFLTSGTEMRFHTSNSPEKWIMFSVVAWLGAGIELSTCRRFQSVVTIFYLECYLSIWV